MGSPTTPPYATPHFPRESRLFKGNYAQLKCINGELRGGSREPMKVGAFRDKARDASPPNSATNDP